MQLYSKQMIFRLGAEPRTTGVYIKVNEDCETTIKRQESRFRRKAPEG